MDDLRGTDDEAHGVTYSQLLRFFLPLGTTWLMVGLTHSIVNATLARLPYGEMSIAIFSVVMSITTVISAPTLMGSQALLSLVDDKRSFYLLKRFVWGLGGLLFIILSVLGYTPLGGLFLRNIMGLTEPDQIEFAYMALRITAFLPLVETLRNSNQGLLIGLKRTIAIFFGILFRLFFVLLFFGWVTQYRSISGLVAGSLMWVMGLGIEGLFTFLYLTFHYGSPGKAVERLPEHDDGLLTLKAIFSFYLPLGLMMSLMAFIQPTVQAGIARSMVSPVQSLAAYGVARTLVMTFSGPLYSLHQCPLVFREEAHRRVVYRFCLMIGGMTSLLLIVLVITPLGTFVVRELMGLSEPLGQMVLWTMLSFSLYPLIRSYREFYWGLLMERRRTSLIAMAKVMNILTVMSLIFLAFILLRITEIEAAVVGALAFTMGELVETLWIRLYGRGEKRR